MSFSFAVKETLSGFRRAKLSTFLSIVKIAIALTLLGAFTVITRNGIELVANIRNKIELEVFLNDRARPAEIEEIQKTIQGIEGVESVRYISKEEAAKIFKEEFGEDINRMLASNPLPASFKISLLKDYRTADKASRIEQEIQHLQMVDEVIYRKNLLEFIDRWVRMLSLLALGFGALIVLSAVFLVSNTLRLSLHSKQELIQTMRDLGATSAAIRMLILLEGTLVGLVGGLSAAATLYLLLEVALSQLASELIGLLSTNLYDYGALVLVGAVLGLLSSGFSIRRFVKEPKVESLS